eukprot:CAMPEP_0204847180 /NCGR_PEP_ID=MMETSP1347-20130617/2544_1 /ASSEMBLY_ACC=CAM_ASM_000690 /TAXON_ID=215587 /ORGANISM="Aplanochytrium stocchinoi, Strain GSBS06" /LENGTH=180 /DNA_ID=CAMNT_0051988031 /DNA_START=63 /DNA_END=602 /DNA_ORIENTATION=+
MDGKLGSGLAFAGCAVAAFIVGVKLAPQVRKWKNKDKYQIDEAGDHVAVRFDVLSISDLVTLVSDPGTGAISTFSGTTRDNFEGKEVVRLEYECYESMALKELKNLCSSIRAKWDVKKIAIEHRLGLCPVEESSVIIAVSAVHRGESLEAVKYAINTLKATVPIWKKEVYNNNESVKAVW